MGSILQALLEQHKAQRLYEIEQRQDGKLIKGDFEGSVTGQWMQLGSNGSGIVLYKGKEYITRPIGFTSLTSGTPVELSHADGVYYSKW